MVAGKLGCSGFDHFGKRSQEATREVCEAWGGGGGGYISFLAVISFLHI